MSWQTDIQILARLTTLIAQQKQLVIAISKLDNKDTEIELRKLARELDQVEELERVLVKGQTTLASAVSSLVSSQQTMQGQLAQILQMLIPPVAVSCIGTITLDQPIGDNSMNAQAKKLTATGDLSVADDGTFTGTLTFKDADGVVTSTPTGLSSTFVSSDAAPGPSIFNLVNPGPSGDGSTFAGSVNQSTVAALVAAGTPLPTGLTISFTATWTGLVAPVTGTFAPNLDVVAGPATSAVAQVSTP